MAVFTYYWKSAQNERHQGEIEAKDRDAAFAALRARGIRAIKVEPKGWETGTGYRGLRKRAVAGALLGVALVVGGVAYWSGLRTPHGDGVQNRRAGDFSVVAPLARQVIPGDRVRLANMPSDLFGFATERTLARFAEPGRMPENEVCAEDVADYQQALGTPIRARADEFTEYVDLKRIVMGMKREMQAYLAGGGTVEDYARELVKRQRQEQAFRERAEKHLVELLGGKKSVSEPKLASAAYDYWLKANAQLDSMGIYRLPLPDALRSYQMTVDLDD